jgi:hypothetical protein
VALSWLWSQQPQGRWPIEKSMCSRSATKPFVKRLSRTGGRVMMISDNREMFPPEEVPKHLGMPIFGRVMCAGRTKPTLTSKPMLTQRAALEP